MIKKCAWETYHDKELKRIDKLCDEYRDFLDHGKTERECVDTIVNTIDAHGYQELDKIIKKNGKLKYGDKV
ncbi:MAG: aminopeptidase, partial [Lachnospiraceae bacterium]|nr:aminopeptidase [Lachnospiraceae bacterium]